MHIRHFHFPHLGDISRYGFLHTIGWAVLLCALIVGLAATIGRATLKIQAALSDNPDIAVYLLLPNEGISDATLLRELPGQRDYLVQTKDGPKLVKLKQGMQQWYVSVREDLRK
jgi:hypothetical protein